MLHNRADALTFAAASGIWRILGINPGERVPIQPPGEQVEELRRLLTFQLGRAANWLYRVNHVTKLYPWQTNFFARDFTLLESRLIANGLDLGYYQRVAAFVVPEAPRVPGPDVSHWSGLIGALAMMLAALENPEWNRFEGLAFEFCGGAHAQCMYRAMELPDVADFIRRILAIRRGETCPRPPEPVLDLLGLVLVNQIIIEGRTQLEEARLMRETNESSRQAAYEEAVRGAFNAADTAATTRAHWGTVLQPAIDDFQLNASDAVASALREVLARLRASKLGTESEWDRFVGSLRMLDIGV